VIPRLHVYGQGSGNQRKAEKAMVPFCLKGVLLLREVWLGILYERFRVSSLSHPAFGRLLPKGKGTGGGLMLPCFSRG
jgi:hypothetical protein